MGDGASDHHKDAAIGDSKAVISPEIVTIVAGGEYGLHGFLFLPKEKTSAYDRLVIISAATGVPQRFYFSFASFLASNGIAALTYDYRGVGASRPSSLRGFRATLQDWIDDFGYVIRHVRKAFPASDIVALGHSIGGVAALLNPEANSVRRIITVGAQTSFWKDWPANVRYQRFVLWHILMPMINRLFGYYPAQRFGLGEDLPYDFALNWAASWRNPRGVTEILPNREPPSLTCDVTAIGVADDTIGTRSAIHRLHADIRAKSLSYRWIHPAEYGLSAIGHFDLFRKKVGHPVWPLLLHMVAE